MLHTIKMGIAIAVIGLFSCITTQAAPPIQANAAAQATTGNPIDELQAQIDALYVSVNSLEERVTLTEQNIANLQAQADSLQQQILANDGDINALENQLKTTNAMIYKLQEQLKQLNKVVAMKQNIVTGTCPDGQYLSSINSDGSVVCAADAGANGLKKTVVYKSVTLKECFCLFHCDDPCSTQPSGTYYATCPAGTTLSGGGFTVGPWTDVSANYASGRSWAVHASVAPVAMYGGSELVVSATCLSPR